MIKIVDIQHIKSGNWSNLVQSSPVASWFQTREAYDFFDSVSFLESFCVGVENDGVLKGIVVGYIQKDGGWIKTLFSRRAIINGGPLLANTITEEELTALLTVVINRLKRKAIYIETRNFNDFRRWRGVFEKCMFLYEPHLDFQVDCSDLAVAESKIGKHRRRYIRLSQKNGATIVEQPTVDQIKDYYLILTDLYRTKVKMPLYPFEFFLKIFNNNSCRFILIDYCGSIIGGSVLVCTAKTVYEWFACGKDGIYKNIYPSSLTKYAGIKFAHEQGCSVFDMMGAGKPNEEYGVRDFKAEFGGELVEYGRFKCICNKLLYKIGELGVSVLKKLK